MVISLMSIVKRIQGEVARSAQLVPSFIQNKISGVVSSNNHYSGLDPHFNLLASLRPYLGDARLVSADPVRSRENFKQEMRSIRHRPTLVQSIHDFDIDGQGGPIAVRHYRPLNATRQSQPLPVMVFFHGGGFVVGNLDTHDEACRLLCHYANVQVLSVDYRLAPEHKAPAAVEDALSATLWAFKNAAAIGGDSRQIIVAGDSAGGNLAAVMAQQLKDHEPPLLMQMPIYPVIDVDGDYPSRHLYDKGLFLTGEDLKIFRDMYLKDASVNVTDPKVSPLKYVSQGLAPAFIITAEFDILRDEGQVYAEALKKVGVATEYECFQGLGHGFLNLTFINKRSYEATKKMALQLRHLIDQLV